MPLFLMNKQGVQEMHTSDCETCDPDQWSQSADSECQEEEVERAIARAAGCTVDVWQRMTVEEGNAQLRRVCKAKKKARARRALKRKVAKDVSKKY